MDRRTGFPPSNGSTTYHSFTDVELFEPASPPSLHRIQNPSDIYHDAQQGEDDDRPSTATTMKRQDSGYGGSNGATPRTSTSYSRSPPQQQPLRRSSNASVAGTASGSRPRTRPSTRRSAKSYHHPPSTGMTTSNNAVIATTITPQQFYTLPPSQLLHRPAPQHHHSSPSAYFHFPSPPSTAIPDTDDDYSKVYTYEPMRLGPRSRVPPGALAPPSPSPPTPAPSSVMLPPQTIHYWTSDRTRRLEYAAMDAASRGFKGWVRRNLVPDCMLAKEGRHVAFDDDSGSVRRYRLELEDDQQSYHREKARRDQRRKSWHFWSGSD